MTELERHKKAMAVALEVLDVCTRHMESEKYTASTTTDLARINAILNPPPSDEEVEVVRWECKECASTYNEEGIVISKSVDWKGCGCSEDSNMRFRLTGTITRPVPQKVEKSVNIPVVWKRDNWIVYPCSMDVDSNIHQFEGKTGTLTFIWQE